METTRTTRAPCEEDDGDARIYAEVHDYLRSGSYPSLASKADKAVIRKRAKKFHLADGGLSRMERG